MTDELDSMTDAKLSETFAVAVVRWKYKYAFSDDTINLRHEWLDEKNCVRYDVTSYATDANAVLPWLYKYATWGCDASLKVRVDVFYSPFECSAFAYSSTFPRAACIALIRAKRAEKQQQGETPCSEHC